MLPTFYDSCFYFFGNLELQKIRSFHQLAVSFLYPWKVSEPSGSTQPALNRLSPMIGVIVLDSREVGVLFLIPRRSLNNGNQGGPSLKDPLQVLDGPITRSRAKKIKKAMQRLVQSTWDEASKSPIIKVGLKEGEPISIHLIQAVEDMTQGSLGLLLFKAFNLLKD